MKFHEPDWVGEVLQCNKCHVKFTLEAEDEGLVKPNKFIVKTGRLCSYEMECPKCNGYIPFYVFQKKEQEISLHKHEVNPAKYEPQSKQIEASLLQAPKCPEPEHQPIDVEAQPIDGEMDVRALRRRLLNNND